MEKEETLFALRAPEIGEAADETQTVVSDGGELLIKIRSRKQKIVNGKVVETTTPSCKVTMGESWLSSRVEVDNQYNILDVYFDIEENISSSERIAVITVTQNESGKKLIIHIIQKAGVTYTGVIEIPQSYTISLANKAGASTTFEFTAYLLGSDGSKVAEKPSVSSLSSWLEVTSVEKGSSEHSYVVTFTANSSHSSNLSRVGKAVIHCGMWYS
nr:MAG: Putative binding domain, N-terminal [Bacteriophage sp.]